MTAFEQQLLNVLTRIADGVDRWMADVQPACDHDSVEVGGTMGAVEYHCGDCGNELTAEEYLARQEKVS